MLYATVTRSGAELTTSPAAGQLAMAGVCAAAGTDGQTTSSAATRVPRSTRRRVMVDFLRVPGRPMSRT